MITGEVVGTQKVIGQHYRRRVGPRQEARKRKTRQGLEGSGHDLATGLTQTRKQNQGRIQKIDLFCLRLMIS